VAYCDGWWKSLAVGLGWVRGPADCLRRQVIWAFWCVF
jgi:hypothetical protein